MRLLLSAVVLAVSPLTTAGAAPLSVPMYAVTAQGEGSSIGEVSVTETPYGTLFTPHLTALPPGLHGFHLHEHASCEPGSQGGEPAAALGAGGHYDPDQSGVHLGPYGEGHRGDLPALFVGADGEASQPVLAPRLKLAEVRGRALMIHAAGDNYSDHPKPLGGGGARIACGVAPLTP